jgi:extracellular factor (EF) 3-hydroxypalmitic acid methyl ester biosynthesis protein
MAMSATHKGLYSVHQPEGRVAGATDPALLLDRTLVQIVDAASAAEIGVTFEQLLASLDDLRGSLDARGWRDFVAATRKHPLQEPYTRRAFLEPRGYAGDAEMLDFVYSGVASTPTTARGSALFRALAWQSHTARAIRARKALLARMVDEVAARKSRPRVLSLACGHLREADVAKSVEAALVDYVAVDEEPESLLEVERRLGSRGVAVTNASVRAVLRREVTFRDFDFVYAAGLYDYLSPYVARRLTEILFEATAPGGKLLVTNFVPDHPGRAYMEAFMDWSLMYRTHDELRGLTTGIDDHAVDNERVFQFEPCIAYLELTRRPAGPSRSSEGRGSVVTLVRPPAEKNGTTP